MSNIKAIQFKESVMYPAWTSMHLDGYNVVREGKSVAKDCYLITEKYVRRT